MKYLVILILFQLTTLLAIGQWPKGLPSPYSNGFSQIGYTKVDSGLILTSRDTNWTPRFNGTIVRWLHSGVDTCLWQWNTHWYKLTVTISDINSAVSAATLTFSNGLTKTSNNVKLGGSLTANTALTGNYQLSIDDGTFKVIGNSSFGGPVDNNYKALVYGNFRASGNSQFDNYSGFGIVPESGYVISAGGNIKVLGKIENPKQTLTCADTTVWNMDNSCNAFVVLDTNTILYPTFPAGGTHGTIIVKQDSIGRRVMTLPANSLVAGGGGTITLSTAANATDQLDFYFDGVTFYWDLLKDNRFRLISDTATNSASTLTRGKGQNLIDSLRQFIGYPMIATASTVSTVGSQDIYLGENPATTGTTANRNSMVFPQAGTIIYSTLFFYNSGTLATNETSTISVRVRTAAGVATVYALQTGVTNNATTTSYQIPKGVINAGAGIPVEKGGDVEFVWTQPAWATPPTNVIPTLKIWVQ